MLRLGHGHTIPWNNDHKTRGVEDHGGLLGRCASGDPLHTVAAWGACNAGLHFAECTE